MTIKFSPSPSPDLLEILYKCVRLIWQILLRGVIFEACDPVFRAIVQDQRRLRNVYIGNDMNQLTKLT